MIKILSFIVLILHSTVLFSSAGSPIPRGNQQAGYPSHNAEITINNPQQALKSIIYETEMPPQQAKAILAQICGVDPYIINVQVFPAGDTLLHQLARLKRVGLFKHVLYALGASADIPNNNGETVRDITKNDSMLQTFIADSPGKIAQKNAIEQKYKQEFENRKAELEADPEFLEMSERDQFTILSGIRGQLEKQRLAEKHAVRQQKNGQSTPPHVVSQSTNPTTHQGADKLNGGQS